MDCDFQTFSLFLSKIRKFELLVLIHDFLLIEKRRVDKQLYSIIKEGQFRLSDSLYQHSRLKKCILKKELDHQFQIVLVSQKIDRGYLHRLLLEHR